MVVLFLILYSLIGLTLYFSLKEVDKLKEEGEWVYMPGVLFTVVFWPAICIGSILIVIAKTLLRW